jgi:hypothetical protein
MASPVSVLLFQLFIDDISLGDDDLFLMGDCTLFASAPKVPALSLHCSESWCSLSPELERKESHFVSTSASSLLRPRHTSTLTFFGL